MATHPPYDLEFRRRIVELVRRGDRPVLSIAKEFGCSDASIYKWLRQSDLEGRRKDALRGALPTSRFDQTSGPLSIFCQIFFRRLPGPRASDPAVVDSLEQHGQLRRIELHSERVVFDGRHAEPASLQSLVIEDEATALPDENLHPVAPLADEGEQVAAVDVLLPLVADDGRQAVDGVAHVDGRRGQIDADGLRKAKHLNSAESGDDLREVTDVGTDAEAQQRAGGER